MVCNRQMDKLKAYVALVGLGAFAKLLGVSAQRLSNWLERGVPIGYCSRVERVSGAVVLRQDLRPDDWREIWPELAANDQAREVAHG